MKTSAFAKINLSLAVTGVRSDGYHTLRTVMQSISLCDTVDVTPATTLHFSCSDPALDCESNLCVRAYRAFYAAVGTEEGASIHLEKRIPTGAGLGGGSADAAAVLRLLNVLCDTPLTERQLFAVAEGLGADVPFCLHGGKCLCTGIGEKLSPLPEEEPLFLVVAKGKTGLSTPEMYRRLDERRKRVAEELFLNAFEPVAMEVLADIGMLKQRLLILGASEARMTGSGSAVFGIFHTSETAEQSAAILRQEGYFAASCRTISRY